MTSRTIAAIATPIGPGGIGIIKISGSESIKIIKKLFLKKKRYPVEQGKIEENIHLCSHVFYYGYIIDPYKKEVIDEVLTVYMKSPRSFTAEDVVEIHSHSGYVVLDRILSLVIDAGAQLAQPGEFTKRAFINGRIDLTQAEGVIDIINAPCENALKMAVSKVSGGLRVKIEKIQDEINRLIGQCEASIEFGDEIENNTEQIVREIKKSFGREILAAINALIKKHKEHAIYREENLLSIIGIPNVGKSSLLNKLLEKEAAIVTSFPGTTRDIVKEYITINGLPVTICDTAGICESDDPIERIGIQKTHEFLKAADLVLMVVEANRRLNQNEKKILNQIKNRNVIVVINKDDINDGVVIEEFKHQLSHFQSIRTSAKYGIGIEELKKEIFRNLVLDTKLNDSQWVSPNLRQRKILEKAKKEVVDLIKGKETVDVLAEKAKQIGHIFEEITGKREKDNLYDYIFSQFCIGK